MRSYLVMTDADQTNDRAPQERVAFEINDVNSPEATMALCAGVQGLNGVREVQFVDGAAIVTFNPLGITKEEICTALQRAGYHPSIIESA